MGDAKRRGTFEERKAASIARQKIETECKVARGIKIEAAKTPEERLRGHRARMDLLMLLVGMTWAYNPQFKHR
jgi:hypothetical protein